MRFLRAAVCGALASSAVLGLTRGKTVYGNFQLEAGDFDSGPEYEITKFSFAVGTSVITGKFIYKDPHTWMTSPALYMFKDEQWDQYHAAPACTDKTELADAMVPIGKLTQSHQDIAHVGEGRATKSDLQPVPGQPGFVEWTFEWEIKHETRTHGWFVIVADCALEQYNAQVPPMQFEVSLFNPGNTHLPADEYGLPKMYLFTFVAMCVYLAYLVTLLLAHLKETGNKTHLVVRLLLVSYIMQLVSFFCELVHLWVYKGNGTGIFAMDLVSEILEGLSQTLIAFVLICLASGWTLVETSSDSSRANSVATMLSNPTSLFTGPNVAVFVIIVLVVFTTVLQILNKSYDADFSKFHDHDSKPGQLLVAMRFMLGVAFVLSLHFTIKSQSNRGGDRLVSFMKQLMLLGGLWFLSFPLVVFLANFLPHYYRHRFVTSGVMILQTLSLATLGHQFMSNHSTYFKISTLADSGVLPGAGGLVRAPKVSRD